jgi:AraC-like DNA-binding protein
MNQPRTLPIHLPPLPGEGIDSWLEAFAHRLHVPLTHLLPQLGLPGGTHPAARQSDPPTQWTTLLRPHQAQSVATACGTTEAAVHAMTLAHYDGRALLLDHATGQVNRRRLWGRATGSRFCPDCLRENHGRWPLAWRLGWIYACVRHRRLLADACPGCGSPQRMRPHHRRGIPLPGRCANRRPGPWNVRDQHHRCDYPLQQTPVPHLPTGHPALNAQQQLIEVIEHGTASFGRYRYHPHPALAVLSDVRALAAQFMAQPAHGQGSDAIWRLPTALEGPEPGPRAARTPRPRAARRPGFMAPADAADTAVALSAAMDILADPDVHRAGQTLHQRIPNRSRKLQTASFRTWGLGTSPVLTSIQLAAVAPELTARQQLRFRTASPQPRRPDTGHHTVEHRNRHLPALLWAAPAARISVTDLAEPTYQRSALSAALMLIGTEETLHSATAGLGGAATVLGSSWVLQRMRERPHWFAVQQALLRLADHIDTHPIPIDYARRRSLDYSDLLTAQQWQLICINAGWHWGGERRLAMARSFLIERLTGTPARVLAPELTPDDPDARSLLARAPALLPAAVREGLDHRARQFLAQHHINEEPLTWRPPLDLLDGLDLAGPDVRTIDIIRLHQLITQQHCTIPRAAVRLGTSSTALHYALGEYPVPMPPAARIQLPGIGIPTSSVSEEELARLYRDEDWSLAELAELAGMSKAAVKRRLHRQHVVLHPRGARHRTKGQTTRRDEKT